MKNQISIPTKQQGSGGREKSWEEEFSQYGYRLEMKSIVDRRGSCWKAIATHRILKKRRLATGRKAEEAYAELLEKIKIDCVIYKAILGELP